MPAPTIIDALNYFKTLKPNQQKQHQAAFQRINADIPKLFKKAPRIFEVTHLTAKIREFYHIEMMSHHAADHCEKRTRDSFGL